MAKGVILNPRQIMTDMELGAMKAFKYQWTSASIKACLFHVGQAWFKKLAKLGLQVAYGDDPKLQRWFKKVFTMALISPDDVDEFWEKVIMAEYETLKGLFLLLCGIIFIQLVIEQTITWKVTTRN